MAKKDRGTGKVIAEVAKLTQVPALAPRHFRRVWSSKGFLAPPLKNEDATGYLVDGEGVRIGPGYKTRVKAIEDADEQAANAVAGYAGAVTMHRAAVERGVDEKVERRFAKSVTAAERKVTLARALQNAARAAVEKDIRDAVLLARARWESAQRAGP